MSSTIPSAGLRRARGWTQDELARRAGVSRAEISAIETGRVIPSVATALRIAHALGHSVEAVFGTDDAPPPFTLAWPAREGADGRTWQAAVGDRILAYPVEPTAAGTLPHDAWFDGRQAHDRRGVPPERTLVIAGCDPLVGLLQRELAQYHQVRVVPLLRSSQDALELLRQGLVHVAGLHVTDADGRSANAQRVRKRLGAGYRLLHQLMWESGIAVDSAQRARSVSAIVRGGLRWVNREEGSAARETLDALLGSRKRPSGYEHVVRDHRAVATTVASGWAEAGVCVRPVAAELQLSFVAVHREAYELCVPDALLDDARIVALLATLRSATYRSWVADVPGCRSTHTGDVRAIA